MGSFGPLHWLLLAAVVLLLFGGRGKLSEIMGDFAKGIKSFKKGLTEEDDKAKSAEQKPAASAEQRPAPPPSEPRDPPAH